jgi:nickel superoxide dismutase
MLKILLCAVMFVAGAQSGLNAHCQLPCGIYHDDMVFDQVDQYVETMVKAVTVLTDSKFTSLKDHNEFVRWVMQKDRHSDETATLLCSYFLQQKIKPGEDDTAKRVLSVHKMLVLIVQIKQSVDLKLVNDFYEEWEKFKLMFHIQGYECKMEQIKLKQWAEKNAKAKGSQKEDDHTHDHDHEHDHDHDHGHDH